MKKKKKEEEERIKKEKQKKIEKEEEEIHKKIQDEVEIEYQKLKEEELSKILPSDYENPSKSCTFLGLYGNFFTDKERALERINKIRKEACNEGVKDPETKKKFKASDYRPLKWSTELEFIARIRAAEGCLTIDHTRLNGKDIWSVEKNGVRSWFENLAWNWNKSNSIDMINQWYEEKKDWVTGGKGVTGHYESLISSRFKYVGLGWFNTTVSKYPSCLAGSFSMKAHEEDFLEEKKDIIQTLDTLNNKISSCYLEGKKTMKTNESQILIPRVKLKSPALTLWPLKTYDLTYTSSNPKIVQVYKTGKVYAFKQGNVVITCKNADNSKFATFNIEVKCAHEKNLIETVEATCTKTGSNTYECLICNIKVDSKINMKPHDYKLIKTVEATCTKTGINSYVCEICKSKMDSKINMKPHDYKYTCNKGRGTGTCKICKKSFKYNGPTMFEFYWRNNQTTEGSNYWGSPPGNNPIGSCIEGWVYKINGDNDYKELVAECDNEEAIELPKEKIGQFVDFKVIGSGNAILSIYCKYNPTLKQTYKLKLGDY